MKKFFTMFLIALSAILLAGCKSYKISVPEEFLSIEMEEKETVKVEPIYTEGTTLNWTSSDTKVVTVKDGLITAIGAGTAKVTITMVDHEDISCEITVKVNKIPIKAVTINGPEIVYVGNTGKYELAIDPKDAEMKSATWTIAEEEIATIDKQVVKGIKAGKATIKVDYEGADGKKGTATKQIEVKNVDVTGINLTYKEAMKIGEKQTIGVNIKPDDATFKEVTYTSSDDKIATVNNKGEVEAKAEGNVKITVASKANPDKKAIATIKVEKPLVNKVTLNHTKDSMLIGETDNLTVTILPELASQEYEFSADPEDCVEITPEGLLTAKKEGKVLIRATAKDGSKVYDEYELTIIKPASTKVKIGETEYNTLKEALAAAQSGDVLVIDGQQIEDTITIDKSNLTFTKNNESIDPVSFMGDIKINENIKDIKFENVQFVNGSSILGAENGGIENITLNKCVFIGTNADPSIGFITFLGSVKNFVFTNNIVKENKAARFFRFKVLADGLTIKNNKFEDGSPVFDWMYVDGYTQGEINISNNYFGSTQQTAINIQHHASGNYYIADNDFINILHAAIDIRSLKSIQDVTPKSTFTILHNNFNNTDVATSENWGCMRLRFKGYEVADLKVNINYNKIINWNLTNIVDDAGENKFAAPICNLDNNYIEGLTTEGVDNKKNFGGIGLSWNNLFESVEDLEAAYEIGQIDNDPHALLVGKTDKYTKKPYATLKEALEAAKDNDVIYLLPGAHTGDVIISKNNITITSLNGLINPNKKLAREAEATYNGHITLGKEVQNITISGIKFIEGAQITNVMGAVGQADATKMNIKGFRFENNIVESALKDAEGFMYTKEAASCYSYDIHIINNYFTATKDFTAKAMLSIDNNYDVKVEGNVFENIKAENVLHFTDSTKGLSGQNSNINSNTFNNITGNALRINWLSSLPNGFDKATVSIQNNNFENVSELAIYVGKMNNSDAYETIKVRFNKFTNVGSGIRFERVHAKVNILCNYNIFYDVPKTSYIEYGKSAASPSKLDATDNLYLDNKATITPDKAKMIEEIAGMINYETTIKSEADLPTFDSKATSIEIVCPDLYLGDEAQVEINYLPGNIQNKGVKWSVDDETVAKIDEYGVITCLKEGKVTITAVYLFNEKVTATKEINITSFKEIKFDFDNDGYLTVGESFDITATIQGSNTEGKIVWSSKNPDIAKVENGKVTALKEGEATIVAKIEGEEVTTTYTVVVKDLSEMDELLKLLVENNNGVVWNETINYYGYESGYEKVPHNIFGSVNNYFAGKAPEVTENPIGANAKNMPGEGSQKDMESLEFITIHDTGSATPTATASANSHWCTNPSNDGTSWHYTIGNDGIFHQVEDTKVTWHAGDGTEWGTTTVLRDTGIKADPDLRNRGKVTCKDGYFYVNGQKTNIKLPEGADPNAPVNDTGYACVVKNGTYHLPTAHVLKNGVVSARGGNLNSIGIETAVNQGSDVYLTWQYVAKFVATLLVKHNLTPDRVLFHNSWSNKTCPQTMMRSNKCETFLDMVYIEYYVLKNYSDYKIEFISNNPDIIDNTGRVIGHGPYASTEVSYTIKVTKGTETKSAVCHCLVQGSKLH